MRKRLCWAGDGNGADDGAGGQKQGEDKDKAVNGHKAGSCGVAGSRQSWPSACQWMVTSQGCARSWMTPT